jgi:hypothetical protein
VYFSTDSNHIEVGWNSIYDVRGCRGIQFHSSPLKGGGPKDPTGRNQFDLSVHDNVIHDTQCDGIIFATVDPSRGKVEAYNNVIYNAGKGPAPPEKSGNWSCIYVSGATNTGAAGGGAVEVYNNTLVNCGTFPNPPYPNANNAIQNGGANPELGIRIRNNIIYQTRSVPYLAVYSRQRVCAIPDNCRGIFGSHNLFFGNGPAPSNAVITDSLNKDPLFLNAAANDYRLRPSSPARGAGVQIAAGSGGQAKPDLGAYPFPASSPGSALRTLNIDASH